MGSYDRQSIDVAEIRDEDGRVLDFVRRWRESPPDEAYSVVTHPQRHAPLQAVADALIGFLGETHDVSLDEDVKMAADLLLPAGDVVRGADDRVHRLSRHPSPRRLGARFRLSDMRPRRLRPVLGG